ALRADLDSAGLEAVDTSVTLVLGGSKVLPGQEPDLIRELNGS
ncbi:MAG: hypothetical protein QG597_2326, partial [Actinomycetota bacterium]|nr:hypothetical protein [Actinomycetota bacterium]